jgi:hypothetical protein
VRVLDAQAGGDTGGGGGGGGGGSWLVNWREQFGALSIAHLRSSWDHHPAPYDSFALQQWAALNGRTDVVDLDVSVRAAQRDGGEAGACDCALDKTASQAAAGGGGAKGKGGDCGFRGNFRLPSTRLFEDFVAHLIGQCVDYCVS